MPSLNRLRALTRWAPPVSANDALLKHPVATYASTITLAALATIFTTSKLAVLLTIALSCLAIALMRDAALRRDVLPARSTAVLRVLDNLTKRHTARFVESVELTYYIGAADTDRVTRRYTVDVPEGQELHWRRWQAHSPNGGGLPKGQNVQFQQIRPPKARQDIQNVIIVETATQVSGLLLFNPAVSGESLEYQVSYPARDLWSELRATGRDSTRYTCNDKCALLKIRLIFEDSYTDIGCFVARGPDGAAIEQDGNAPMNELSWTVVKPPQGRYIFEIGAAQLKR
jgi:hypothetical protein